MDNSGQGNDLQRIELDFFIIGKDFTSAGEASSRIKYTLQHIGYNSGVIRRTAIAAYEAEMNVVIHADSGTMHASITPEQVEITVEDQGPGIPDIEMAMQEGYSTAPDHIRELGFGAGMGLPNIVKCSDEFYISTEVGKGTRVKMVLYNK
jgi:serine/threonine-protein kinase RsbT